MLLLTDFLLPLALGLVWFFFAPAREITILWGLFIVGLGLSSSWTIHYGWNKKAEQVETGRFFYLLAYFSYHTLQPINNGQLNCIWLEIDKIAKICSILDVLFFKVGTILFPVLSMWRQCSSTFYQLRKSFFTRIRFYLVSHIQSIHLQLTTSALLCNSQSVS